jgi:hypothetical protein
LERILKALRRFRLAKDWLRDHLFGSEAEEIVYEALRQDGYVIEPITDVDLGLNLPKETKIALAEEETFKPDAEMAKNGETWFIDVKGKSKETFYVNVRDYQKYWRGLMRLNAHMRIYFYIKSTGEIWFHVLRNPEQAPTFDLKHFSDGDVYVIPKAELEFYKKLHKNH